jgi:hypothetical protein
VHKNRTLILNNVVPQEQTTASDDSASEVKGDNSDNAQSSSNISWIAKHDRHKQLINPAVYQRETQNRLRDIEESRKMKALKRDERERRKINKHLQRHSTQVNLPTQQHGRMPPIPSAYEITLHGIRYQVSNGGSRLVKVPGQLIAIVLVGLKPTQNAIDVLDIMKCTPKRATVGGVTFMRTKNGNLIRAGIVKAKKR